LCCVLDRLIKNLVLKRGELLFFRTLPFSFSADGSEESRSTQVNTFFFVQNRPLRNERKREDYFCTNTYIFINEKIIPPEKITRDVLCFGEEGVDRERSQTGPLGAAFLEAKRKKRRLSRIFPHNADFSSPEKKTRLIIFIYYLCAPARLIFRNIVFVSLKLHFYFSRG